MLLHYYMKNVSQKEKKIMVNFFYKFCLCFYFALISKSWIIQLFHLNKYEKINLYLIFSFLLVNLIKPTTY